VKAKPTVLLCSLFYCAYCSQLLAASDGSAIGLVQSGKFIDWKNGCILYVEKRDGSFLTDIEMFRTTSNCVQSVTHAKSGTIVSGSFENNKDESAVMIKMTDVHTVSVGVNGSVVSTSKEVTIVLHKS
jgi:hypothetical protein